MLLTKSWFLFTFLVILSVASTSVRNEAIRTENDGVSAENEATWTKNEAVLAENENTPANNEATVAENEAMPTETEALAAETEAMLAKSEAYQGRQNVKRSDDSGALGAVVEALAQKVTSLTAQLTAVNNKVAILESETETLKKVVAFHAWASNSPVVVSPRAPIVLQHVQTNIGNGFDAQTGFFTAPVSGLYEFHATFMADDGSAAYVHAALNVDGAWPAVSISDFRKNTYDNTGLHAVVHVTAGKKVYLQNGDEAISKFYGGTYLTFSGFLVHAD